MCDTQANVCAFQNIAAALVIFQNRQGDVKITTELTELTARCSLYKPGITTLKLQGVLSRQVSEPCFVDKEVHHLAQLGLSLCRYFVVTCYLRGVVSITQKHSYSNLLTKFSIKLQLLRFVESLLRHFLHTTNWSF